MKIKDVWFRTDLSLKDISDLIDARFSHWDGESYWEWVISDFEDIRIDITRKDTNFPMEFDTRIFVCGGDEFPFETLSRLIERLQELEISPIYIGQWQYIEGNKFEYIVAKEII